MRTKMNKYTVMLLTSHNGIPVLTYIEYCDTLTHAIKVGVGWAKDKGGCDLEVVRQELSGDNSYWNSGLDSVDNWSIYIVFPEE